MPLSRVALFLLIGVQAAFYCLMWFRLLDDPSLKTMDFISFYGAGRLARSGEQERIYDLQAQAVAQGEAAGSNDYPALPFIHPPYLIPVLSITATEDYVLSYILWTLIRLVALALCAVLIYRFLRSAGWDTKSTWLGLAGCLLFFPIFISLLGGQDTVFVLIGLLAWVFAFLKGREVAAGLGLAFATLMPTIAGALTLPVLSARRRTGFWFLAGVGGLAVYSFLLVGAQGITDFIRLLLITSRAGTYGFEWAEMYNMIGLLMRVLPALNVELARGIGWGAAFLSILILSAWWWRERGQLNIYHIGMAVLAITFVSPHLYLHALSILLIPMLGFMTLLWDRGFRAGALLFIPAVSTTLMLTVMLAPNWSFAAFYMLMIILAYGFWRGLAAGRQADRASISP